MDRCKNCDKLKRALISEIDSEDDQDIESLEVSNKSYLTHRKLCLLFFSHNQHINLNCFIGFNKW